MNFSGSNPMSSYINTYSHSDIMDTKKIDKEIKKIEKENSKAYKPTKFSIGMNKKDEINKLIESAKDQRKKMDSLVDSVDSIETSVEVMRDRAFDATYQSERNRADLSMIKDDFSDLKNEVTEKLDEINSRSRNSGRTNSINSDGMLDEVDEDEDVSYVADLELTCPECGDVSCFDQIDKEYKKYHEKGKVVWTCCACGKKKTYNNPNFFDISKGLDYHIENILANETDKDRLKWINTYKRCVLPQNVKDNIESSIITMFSADKFVDWGINETFEKGLTNSVLLFGPPGCIAADTIIEVNRAGKSLKLPISELVYKFNGGETKVGNNNIIKKWDKSIPTLIRSRIDDDFIKLEKLDLALESGEKETFRVETKTGKSIRATHDHPFLTPDGWKKLDELNVGDLVMTEQPKESKSKRKISYRMKQGLRYHPYAGKQCRGIYCVPVHKLVFEANLNGVSYKDFVNGCKSENNFKFIDSKIFAIHHKDTNKLNNILDNLEKMTHLEHSKLHGNENWKNVTKKVFADEVISITAHGVEATYDLTVGSVSNFLGNGFVVHNTGKTMVAETFAAIINKGLLKITNADIQSQIPGESERNIKKAFKDATEKDYVLMLDECDSLLYNRDAVGVIMAGQINTLLSEIENFSGTVIMTTNRLGMLDSALQRRIACKIKLDRPTKEARLQIWKNLMPSKMPNTANINSLSKYDLSGGEIKNVILDSARLAISKNLDNVTQKIFVNSVHNIMAIKKDYALSKPMGFDKSDYSISNQMNRERKLK